MRLLPKTKPVRIRIKSGGEEHASLDTLKHNFCVEDIRPLLDGRLARWLKQRNENELADKIDNFDITSLDTIDGYQHFIMLFFDKDFIDNRINTLIELAEYWEKTPGYKKNSIILYRYLVHKELKAAKKIYKENILDINWRETFLQFSDLEEDSEAMYLLGKLMFDAGELEIGNKYIRKAAQKGNCKEAFEFISKGVYEQELEKNSRFYGVNKEAFMHISIYDLSYLNPKWVDTFNGKDKEVALFIYRCVKIIYFLKHGSPCDALNRIVDVDYFYYRQGQLLENEMEFIIGLMYDNKENMQKAKEHYNLIAHKYLPAAQMLERSSSFCRMLRSKTSSEQISYIVEHLFEFE